MIYANFVNFQKTFNDLFVNIHIKKHLKHGRNY